MAPAIREEVEGVGETDRFAGKAALVTGGAGFIGSHIVEGLLIRGARVRVFDDLSTGKKENLDEAERAARRHFASAEAAAQRRSAQPAAAGKGPGRTEPAGGGVSSPRGEAPQLEFFQGDIRDLPALRAAMRGVDCAFHLAALASVTRSIEDPITSNAVNIQGTTNAILAARDAGVKRIVFASSSAVYGELPELPKREEMMPSPLSPYAAQKLAGEVYAAIGGPLWGVEMVPMRFFNVFGPRQDPKSEYAAVIPRFAAMILAGKAPTIFGDGGQTRDFTYVENVVQACLLAALAPSVSVQGGRVFNVGSGDRTSLLDLAKLIAEIAGRPEIRPSHAPPRAGDIRHSQASIDRIRTILGYEPRVTLRQGLELTVHWAKEKGVKL